MLPLLTGCSVGEATQTQTKESPNIIFILADDLGYGDLSSYNPDGKLLTPNLDNMAENGVRFTDAHTSSAVSTPTRYGVLTGRYNWRSELKSGVLSGFSRSLITPDRTTVASMLADNGYTTAYVGKWHLGWDWDFADDVDLSKIDGLGYTAPVNYDKKVKNSPRDHGFDYYYGFCGSLDMAPYVWVENDVPSLPNRVTINVDGKGFWREGATSADFDHTAVLQTVTDKAVDYIAKSCKGDKPYFLYLPLPAPHTPILPTTEFMGKSNTNMYGDFVLQVDDVVRQVREAIAASGEAENTILIFTSDNGCSPRADFKELATVGHNPSSIYRGNKADLYEGGHRVPYIVEWGTKCDCFKRGTVSDATICTTDLFATCVDIVGYDSKDNEGEDSFSYLPILKGEAEKFERKNTVHHSINGSFALRCGDWKVLFAAGSAGWSFPTPAEVSAAPGKYPTIQLYNLKTDPSETNNVAKQNSEIVKKMTKTMADLIRNGRSTEGPVVPNDGGKSWAKADAIFALEK